MRPLPACGGAACLALAIASFIASTLVPDETPVYVVSWIGGVVLGAIGIYLLIVAFPLRERE